MSVDLDWLNLLEVSGPFLAEPILKQAFPDGLDLLDQGVPQRLRATYDEWRNAVDLRDPDLTLFCEAWIDEVLTKALEFDETCIRKGSELPDTAKADLPEHGVHLEADIAIVDPSKPEFPLLLISTYAPDTDLDAVFEKDGLAASPADRMVMLSRRTECPIGLVTNGERWMLVHAPSGSVAGYTSWYARLWGQERETLRAFVSFLGIRRLTGPEENALPGLFERSLAHQGDVTDALGGQVAQAIEVLMRALDRADQDRNRELLKGIPPETIYEAGLTLMMRLVFVLSAEERGLLLLGDPTYDAHYAISSLRAQLAEEDAKVLEHRMSAWSRLLATFRAVYAGIGHPDLHMPAMGGSLFDPDRFEFLEGRKRGTTWRTEPADPLPIDDRTVLLLLEAIQTFKGRTLSYRALDVEQIGHVYEGLLERTVDHVHGVTLQLKASTNVGTCLMTLRELEQALENGQDALIKLLEDKTERSRSAIGNDLSEATEQGDISGLLSSCRGDAELRDRILPFVRLIETDPWGFPLVHHEGAIVVVHGSDRRETGTHYTPKSLTEKIVEETLDPVVYHGPAEGVPRTEWQLKTPAEILDLKICDPAMGSGAFLVQVCRWLAERLLESWAGEEAKGRHIDVEGQVVEDADDVSEPMPRDAEERATLARRMIAEKCLYGVDMNPLAVELAKLSLWLTTLAKGRPFGFLDHNLKSGDSLLGISDLEQLIQLDMNPKQSGQLRLFGRSIRKSVEEATDLRTRLREIPVRDITDVEAMVQLDGQSRRILDLPKLVANAFVGGVLANKKVIDRNARVENIAALSDDAAAENGDAAVSLRRMAAEDLAVDEPNARSRRPFHWPLEFPEVFNRKESGFDVVLGNPPFLGGRRIRGALGGAYLSFLTSSYGSGASGNADLCAFFFILAFELTQDSGTVGFIATNTIGEGDTRRTGLEYIVSNGGRIFFALDDFPWPGSASVTSAVVAFTKTNSAIKCWLGGISVNEVTASLKSEQIAEKAKILKANMELCFQGSVLAAKGFVLTKEEALLAKADDPRNEEVIRPYFTGEEVFNLKILEAKRSVISFFDFSIERAASYALPFKILETKVKPVRAKVKRKAHREYWWHHGDKRPKLYKALSSLPKAIVQTRHTKYLCPQMVPTGPIFSDSMVIFPTDDYFIFGLVNSSIHEAWARETSGSIGVGFALRYTHTDCFYTFPLPDCNYWEPVRICGRDLDNAWSNFRAERNLSVNEMMDLVHDHMDTSMDITEIRRLLVELNVAVANAYQFDDFELEFGFHEVPYLPENDRMRFTISENSRREILRRLVELNHRRYQEEVDQGLHSDAEQPKNKQATSRKKKQVAIATPTLKLEPPAPATTLEEPKHVKPEPSIERLYNWLYNQSGKWVPKKQVASATGLAPDELETAVRILVADDDLIVRGEGEETLLKVKG